MEAIEHVVDESPVKIIRPMIRSDAETGKPDELTTDHPEDVVSDAEKAKALDNAFNLDCWRMANTENIYRLIDNIFTEIVQEGKVKLKKDGTPKRSAEKIKHHIRIFILSLYVAHEHDPVKPIRYSRDRNKYKQSSRYNSEFLSYRHTILVSDFLNDAGYVEYHQGFQTKYKSKQSRILTTEKLIRLFRQHELNLDMVYRDPNEPIIKLKDDEKNDAEYEETEETTEMEEQLRLINELLEAQKYELDVDSEKSEILKKRIDFTKKRVTRNFSRGNFNTGGRFYGGFWTNMPKDIRQNIKINGESIVELDYSGLHITMLYFLEGKTPPDGDAYHLDGYQTDKKFRKFVKTMTNIMINASDDENARAGIRGKRYEDSKNNEKVEEKKFKLPPGINSFGKEDLDPVMQAIKDKHSTIQHYFCSDMGVKLQYTDSQIALQIMLHFLDKSIVVLPEHDSFIIQAQYEDELKAVMMQAFKDVMDTDYEIKIDKK
jgi:hypothetical protein